MRPITDQDLGRAYARVCALRWQEEPAYYQRYRTRYEAVVRQMATHGPTEPCDVLEIGGGQLAVLCQRLWTDRPVVADIDDSCFAALATEGVKGVVWDLARDAAPSFPLPKVDVVLCSEVLEHLPVPGHVALARLRERLRPGGVLILTTPNLYRLRNIAFLATGRQIFDHFDLPGDRGFGHVLEYSKEHLEWQLERAGFVGGTTVELQEFHHRPNRRTDRALSALGAPLRNLPRFRDNLVAVARV